jgi:hypothetical protein
MSKPTARTVTATHPLMVAAGKLKSANVNKAPIIAARAMATAAVISCVRAAKFF